MVVSTSFAFALAFLMQSISAAEFNSGKEENRGLRQRDLTSVTGTHLATGEIECRLWSRCTNFEEDFLENDEIRLHQWVCSFHDPSVAEAFGVYDMFNIVATGDEDVNEFFASKGAESGKHVMHIPRADLYQGRVEVALDDSITVASYNVITIDRHRDLSPDQGVSRTLVVRVNANDSQSPSASSLSNDVFGDQVCLKSQMAACSYNKLTIQEYQSGSINNVVSSAVGVVDVNLNLSVTTSHTTVFEAQANAELKTLFGVSSINSIFELVLFVFPPGMEDDQGQTGWAAYAYGWGTGSYYNAGWGGQISAQMHEVGHNIGLHHSGELSGSILVQEYGDQSGYMGFSTFSDDIPKMCYNPAQNWQMNWYADKQIDIDPSTDLCGDPTEYVLNGIDDYGNATPGALLIIKIGPIYIGYNKATGINSGTQEMADQVTLQQKIGGPTQFALTKRISGLNPVQYYDLDFGIFVIRVTYREVQNNNKDAIVELKWVGGTSPTPVCPGPVPTPTPLPTPGPTNPPTRRPTSVPTPGPTLGPTYPPTRRPTAVPTPLPTVGPTNPPTRRPTAVPTPGPTLGPTPLPTTPPTKHPTNPPVPTNPPTVGPTRKPTVAPTPLPTTPPTKNPTRTPTVAPTPLPTQPQVGWQCTASNMLPAPKACGPGIQAGYYPDLTDPQSFCLCTGTAAPGQYTTCVANLQWDGLSGSSQYLTVQCPGGVPCGQGGFLGTTGGACDYPPPLPTAPPAPTNPPTNPPTGSVPSGWECKASSFSGGVGQCGPGIKSGYYPDLTNKRAYCKCTGTNAPSGYNVCGGGTVWDGFPSNWGTYVNGSLNGVKHGKNGYWATNQGVCTWNWAVSNKTKQRDPW